MPVLTKRHVACWLMSLQIANRVTQRSDDTEEACRTRLRVHHENVDVVRNAYADVLTRVRCHAPMTQWTVGLMFELTLPVG